MKLNIELLANSQTLMDTLRKELNKNDAYFNNGYVNTNNPYNPYNYPENYPKYYESKWNDSKYSKKCYNFIF